MAADQEYWKSTAREEFLGKITPLKFGLLVASNPSTFEITNTHLLITDKGIYDHIAALNWIVRDNPHEIEERGDDTLKEIIDRVVEMMLHDGGGRKDFDYEYEHELERYFLSMSRRGRPRRRRSFNMASAIWASQKLFNEYRHETELQLRKMDDAIEELEEQELLIDPLKRRIGLIAAAIAVGSMPFNFTEKTEAGEVVQRRIEAMLWEYSDVRDGDSADIRVHLKLQKIISLFFESYQEGAIIRDRELRRLPSERNRR